MLILVFFPLLSIYKPYSILTITELTIAGLSKFHNIVTWYFSECIAKIVWTFGLAHWFISGSDRCYISDENDIITYFFIRDPFFSQGFSIPAWISNHMSNELWDKIHTLHNRCNYLPMLGLNLTHSSYGCTWNSSNEGDGRFDFFI